MKNSKYQADSGESNYFQPFDKMKLISAAELAKLNARTRKKHWGALLHKSISGQAPPNPSRGYATAAV
jgi:hypothetical protein